VLQTVVFVSVNINLRNAILIHDIVVSLERSNLFRVLIFRNTPGFAVLATCLLESNSPFRVLITLHPFCHLFFECLDYFHFFLVRSFVIFILVSCLAHEAS